MAVGDDAGRPVLRKGEADGGYGRKKKKGNFGIKNAVNLECIPKINFSIKSWFSDFKKLDSKKYIFTKLAHQNTSFPIKCVGP